MEEFDYDHLSSSQQVALPKLTATVGEDIVKALIEQGHVAVVARLNAFMRYESSVVEHLTSIEGSPRHSAQMPLPSDSVRTKPLNVSTKAFSGKPEENLTLRPWTQAVFT